MYLHMKNLKKKKENFIKSKKWSLKKFLISNLKNITKNLGENLIFKKKKKKELEYLAINKIIILYLKSKKNEF